MSAVFGTELIAEMPQRELDAAVGELVPPMLVAGEDAQTPHHVRVYSRPRERGAALVWAGARTSELHMPARALSRRGQRTIVWSGAWPSATLVEYVDGEETSRLDSAQMGSWRGRLWEEIAAGEVRGFGEGLITLLHEHRHAELGNALLDDLYGLVRTPVLLATFHRPYAIAPEAEALAPLLRAVIARVIRDGQTEVRGLGTFVSDAGPPRTFRHYAEDAAIDLRTWTNDLSPAERTAAAQALRHLLARIAPGTDVVVPGLACFYATVSIEYSGTNPRTGEPVVIPSAKRVGVTLINAT